ncbi:hypothetical protein LTR66_009337 [Elasticomyces elasticus]|nr:hypothetical protein LTR66_009337 [Elasticomyces elasticus]
MSLVDLGDKDDEANISNNPTLVDMKYILCNLLLSSAALIAAAPTSDTANRLWKRDAGAQTDSLLYIKRTGCSPDKHEVDAEADPLLYIKRTGYPQEKREPEADQLLYIKRAGYPPNRREAEADPLLYIRRAGHPPREQEMMLSLDFEGV